MVFDRGATIKINTDGEEDRIVGQLSKEKEIKK
jgi:hypothetical protein